MARWVTDDNVALLTDWYELTMLQAYWREEMHAEAVFSLYVRRLPECRNYLVACGLDDVLHYLENLRFTSEALEYLASSGTFSDEFLGWLGGLRFTGDVYAVPEGTPLFAEEPLLEVVAPLPEAQLVETFLMNQVHFQTLVASKAARVVEAAAGRAVVDFGLRRIHGADAGIKAARALYLAGVQATSNVLAGKLYGIPVTGTMAHSYIQAHDDELEAFRRFTALYPETILLVDTYDTLAGVRNVARLGRELAGACVLRGVRLDSGDLPSLAREAREILDAAGLRDVAIFASGGLDEYQIEEFVSRDAPIAGFGVGTRMGVSSDAPSLDIAYKLTAYAGKGRVKLSRGKPVLPHRKQVFRIDENGMAARDIIGLANEEHPGRPLLVKVMERGTRLAAGDVDLATARTYAREQIATLPAAMRRLEPADPPYPVAVSDRLRASQHESIEAWRRGNT